MPVLEVPTTPVTPDQPVVPSEPITPADPTPDREAPATPAEPPDAPPPDDPLPPQPDEQPRRGLGRDLLERRRALALVDQVEHRRLDRAVVDRQLARVAADRLL